MTSFARARETEARPGSGSSSSDN